MSDHGHGPVRNFLYVNNYLAQRGYLKFKPNAASRLKRAAFQLGLTPRAVLEKLSAIQMLDVCLPTTDGRLLVMPRYTQPKAEQKLVLEKLQLELPPQPPPRIRSRPPALPPAEKARGGSDFVVET